MGPEQGGKSEPQARLVVLSGPRIGIRFVIEGAAIIGRDEGATVVLGEAAVSRRHASIEWDAARAAFVIRDLGSRNGTMVNGERVTEAALAFGDRIRVGGHELSFTHPDPADDELRERQRLEALGRVSAGVAHDLNNMLGMIIATLDYLERADDDDADLRECLRDITAAARRAAALTPRLMAFSRSETSGFRPVDVSQLLGEVARLAAHTFPRTIRVESDVTPWLLVNGDVVELHQAFMNLLLCARDAMPAGGVIRIVAEPTLDEGARAPQVAIAIAEEAALADDAARASHPDGVPSSKRDAAPPTERTPGGEAGPILERAREIVALHGGTVAASAARFAVTLPQLAGNAASEVETDRPPMPLAGHTVLIADDEPGVLRTMSRLLRQSGVVVLEARDGAEAVAMYHSGPMLPDVVLLDAGMPNVDGIEALRQLRAMDPCARVIVFTGYFDPAVEADFKARGAAAVLAKPCRADTLLRTVGYVLADTITAPLSDPTREVGDG